MQSYTFLSHNFSRQAFTEKLNINNDVIDSCHRVSNQAQSAVSSNLQTRN